MPGRESAATLSVSLVTYRTPPSMLSATLRSLSAAAPRSARSSPAMLLTIVDNTERNAETIDLRQTLLAGLELPAIDARVLANHGNIGFGRGHNLALDRLGRYHLVLNPDVEMAGDALARAIEFMDAHPECALLSPFACDRNGEPQALCKRYPTVFDLGLRGFAPTWLRKRFQKRLDRYEMRDAFSSGAVVWDPPIVSGCFMLFRSDALRALGGFDPRFFLYFEDFDISLRAARLGRIAHVPSVRIVHHGGNAAGKGWRHRWMFIRSAVRFFSKHGWRLW